MRRARLAGHAEVARENELSGARVESACLGCAGKSNGEIRLTFRAILAVKHAN